MRVLSSVTDPRMGGPQRRTLDVAKRLQRRGIETVFLIPHGDNAFAKAVRNHGFEAHRIRFSRIRPPAKIAENVRFLGDFLPTVKRIRSLLEECNIDVVHANMVMNFQAALATTYTDTPLVWHFNDTLTPSPVKEIAKWAAIRLADEIVVAADAVHQYYFPSKIRSKTIYAPVDVNAFHPDRVDLDEESLREELNLPQNMPVVGTVGNVNPIKGHRYLLHAVAKMVEDGHQVAVPIVGSELDPRKSYSQELYSLRADLDLEDQVKFVGFRSDIPEMLALFDLFVLPSIAEACPIAILEAMAMECPVVATNVGGVPEEIPDDEHGWVIPPKDSDALADGILEALTNPDKCQRLTSNARSRVQSKFSLTACVTRHEKLYQSLTGNKYPQQG